MKRLRAGAVVVAATVGAISCIGVFGLEPLAERQVSPDAAPEADACPPDFIGLARPEAPDTETKEPLLVVMTSLDFGVDLETPGLGFDLDRAQTIELTQNSCVVNIDSGSFAPEEVVTDLVGGIDNGFGRMLAQVEKAGFGAYGAEDLQRRLGTARHGFALRISSWNGSAEDPEIELELIPLVGFGNPLDGGADATTVWGGRLGDGGFIAEREIENPPQLDAGDLFQPDERFLRGVPEGDSTLVLRSFFRTRTAWVSGGVLVARFDRMTLPLRFDNQDRAPSDLAVTEGWVEATLARTDGGETALVGGRLGGRLEVGKLLRSLLLVRVGPNRELAYACDSPARELLRTRVCDSRDIRGSHCDDRAALPCDAISMGARFEAIPVQRLGTPRLRTFGEYADAGLLPPELRCLDSGVVYDCP